MSRKKSPRVSISPSSLDTSGSLHQIEPSASESVASQRMPLPQDPLAQKTCFDLREDLGRPCERRLETHFVTDETTTTSNESLGLATDISRFREDFEELKCKMKIFDESLKLCHCIAHDFEAKITIMEKRLLHLERRQKVFNSPSNYSAIIEKNRILSLITMKYSKKLQMCGTEEEMREVAARICRNYLHGAWKTVEPQQLDFRRISGGLSNFLYQVGLPDDAVKYRLLPRDSPPHSPSEPDLSRQSFTMQEPKKVLLRIYGQVHGERAMDAIVTESVIFTLLSERRLGPKLHGVFSGGRIEEYIPARPLLTKELSEPALSMKIAEKMAAIHSMDVPLSKEPTWLWKTMGKWLKTVTMERLHNNAVSKNEDEERCIKRLREVDFEKEIEWLKKYVATVDSPCVFCHNDMQEGNILMLEDEVQTFDDDVIHCEPSQSETTRTFVESLSLEDPNTSDSVSSRISDSGEPKLVLIDFEYCAYNYRGFDLANHFQEWGYDYTNPEYPFYYENQENMPTLEQKEIFIQEYLKHFQANTSDCANQKPTIDEVNHLLYEVDAFALASHLLWCLWSVVNASKSQIPFGYWEYAVSRLDTYQRLKHELIKKNNFGYPQKRKICEVDI